MRENRRDWLSEPKPELLEIIAAFALSDLYVMKALKEEFGERRVSDVVATAINQLSEDFPD
jgi:hypothetical protein